MGVDGRARAWPRNRASHGHRTWPGHGPRPTRHNRPKLMYICCCFRAVENVVCTLPPRVDCADALRACNISSVQLVQSGVDGGDAFQELPPTADGREPLWGDCL